MTGANVGGVVWPSPVEAPRQIEPDNWRPASLAPLPAARVLHSLASPASAAHFDHLVIGPCGIFTIDVLQGTGTIKWRKDTLWLGGSDLRGECIAARRKASEVGTYLQHAVTPVLCFADAKLPAPVIRLRHVVICSPDIIVQYINGGPRCLDASAVQYFADRASMLRAPGQASAVAMARRDARPHLLRPKRPSAAAPPRHTRSLGRRILATAAGTMVCVGGVWAAPVLGHLAKPDFDQFVRATGYSKSDTTVSSDANDTLTPAPSPTGASQGAAPGPTEPGDVSPHPELLPKLDFTCPQQGAGWTASAVATQFQADPVGYHLWYQTTSGPWQYWGQFKSGIQSPAGIPGLQPGESLDVRMDRSFHPNAEGAPTMLTFTAPDAPC
ncbi:MAG: nuclease-related domain-containing protein [Ilumatobacteraceae bacterium]